MAEGSTREMSDEHRSLLERNKFFFSDHLDLTEKFYNLLLHCKILTDKMYKNIKAKSAGNPDREVRELVDLVTRRGDRALYWFLEVLKQTGQQGIVNHLQQQLGGDTPLAPAGSGHVMAHRPPTKRPIRETGSGDRPPSRFPVQVQSPSGPSPSIRTQSRNFPNHDILMYEGLPWSDRSQENPPESGPREDRLRYPVQARRPGTSHSDLTGATPRTSYPSEGYPRPGIPQRETADERPRTTYPREGAPRTGIQCRESTQATNARASISYAENSVEQSRRKLELMNLEEDDDMETPRHKLHDRGSGGSGDRIGDRVDVFEYFQRPSQSEETPVDPSRKELYPMKLHEDDERETPRHKIFDDGGSDRPRDQVNATPSLSLPSIKNKYEINNPGILVIINIHEFTDPSQNRNGTDEDVNKLYTTFKALGFKVYVKENLNYEDFWKFLNQFLDDRHWKFSSVGLIFMSHGQNDTMFTADLQAVPFREIREAVAKTESLQFKPKLIIFHVCREENNLPEMNATGLEATGRELEELEETEPQMDFTSCGSELNLQPQAGGSQVVDSHLGEGAERGGRGLGNENRGRGGRGLGNEEGGRGGRLGNEGGGTGLGNENRGRGGRGLGNEEGGSGWRGRVNEQSGRVDRENKQSGEGTIRGRELPTTAVSDVRMDGERRNKGNFNIEFDANGARRGGARPTGGSASARGRDMIIVYPTLYGMSAGRLANSPEEYSQYRGSYLITELCEVFNKYAAADFHIVEMLTNVTNKVYTLVQEISHKKKRHAGCVVGSANGVGGASNAGGTRGIDGASGVGGTVGIGGTSGVDGASGVGGTLGISGASGGTPDDLSSTLSDDNVEDQTVEIVSTLDKLWYLKPKGIIEKQ